MRWLRSLFSPWGRIDRRRFWLSTIVAALIAALPCVLFVYATLARADDPVADAAGGLGLHQSLAFVALGLCGAAVPCAVYIFVAACARRFNDRGKSSWWVFSGFVPVIGPIVNLVELGCARGTPGRNRFGPPCRNRLAGVDAVFGGGDAVPVAPAKGRVSATVAVLTAWLATLASIAATISLLFSQRPA